MTMTLTEILAGPKVDRSHIDARARLPMTESNVRHFIADLEQHNHNRNARRRLAELAVNYGSSRGTISSEGIALYRAYLATFG